MDSIDARVDRLLDRLENPAITTEEIEKIERKLAILRKQGQPATS